MVFVLLVSVLFSKTRYLLILVGGIGGQGGIKIASASTHHQLMSQQGPHFSPHSTAKTNVKVHFSGRMLSSK